MRNNRFYIQVLLVIVAFPLLCSSCNQEKTAGTTNDDINVAAYIWPSCHYEERNAEVLWPEGIGEWEIIQKGTPRFEGHYQPKAPLWGYEMDDDPKVMEKWIDAATDHGVNIFIFDWYWFDGKPFLESTINNGFLKAANNEKDINIDLLYSYWRQNKVDLYDGWIQRYIAEILLIIDEKHMPDAEAWIKKAIASNSNNGMMWHLGRDYAFYAELLKRKTDQPKAKEYLGKAIAIFKECGADGWVEKYEKELAAM